MSRPPTWSGGVGRTSPLLAVLFAWGCATASSGPDTVQLHRRDGEAVTCVRPGDQVLDDPESESVSAAFPDLVQLLLDGSTNPGVKEETMHRVASTRASVEYLSYRFCLGYGRDVLDGRAYKEWLGSIEAKLHARARTGG